MDRLAGSLLQIQYSHRGVVGTQVPQPGDILSQVDSLPLREGNPSKYTKSPSTTETPTVTPRRRLYFISERWISSRWIACSSCWWITSASSWWVSRTTGWRVAWISHNENQTLPCNYGPKEKMGRG